MIIRNPRTGKDDVVLACFDHQQVTELADAAKMAQSDWFAAGIEHRVAVLRKLADCVEQHSDELVAVLCEDTGRYNESVLEADVLASSINRWCDQAPALLSSAPEQQATIPFLTTRNTYLPFPLVGVISPWNFPLLLSLIDAVPAMLAGSCVLIKPSEVTSRFVEPFKQVLSKVPELQNIVTLVTGAGETGQAVIDNADLICFTGSVATGRKVGEACAKRFIPAFLELGGKDPAVVCKDADVELAARSLCWGSMVNAGQSCMSLERVYVHKDVAEPFLKKLVQHVSGLKHNYPDIKAGQVGPIISASQVEIVKQHLADAKAKGATVLCGGEVVNLGGGDYCQPTILTDVTKDMDVLSKETFAAVLPVVVVDSDEEALRLANDSQYGLSGAVFSQDLEHAHSIAEQMEAGAISINDSSLTALVSEAEKQSFKQSGLGGSRMGPASIYRFIRKKAFIRNTGVAAPWWF